ncbi:biotin--[acetyl-CoA-carboxylase] ligase [Candidatus Woesearchaeota archaeon]|nr:biotin--[acetyl-CoA-carboxylase] ligase [Candidatus Woesearchaeota archaeon]
MTKIRSGCSWAGRKLFLMRMFNFYYLDKVDSTNKAAQDYGYNSVIIAKEQASGKGRFARTWDSRPGGLWFSVVLENRREAFEYTFIAALAVLKVLRHLKISTEIKWPNDVVVAGKKICGILPEVVSQGDKGKMILGIGINVNNKIPSFLRKSAVSLKEIKGSEFNLGLLVKKIIAKIQELDKYSSEKILIEYKKNCSVLGKEVKAKSLKGIIYGKAIGINKDGRLIIENKGRKLKLNEADVSIL